MGLYHFFLAQAVEPNGFIFWVDKVARTSLSKILIFALILTAVRLLIYPFLKNTPVHKRTGLYSFAKIVNEAGDALIYASVVVFMLVRPFGIQTFHIPTGSMLQTLHERDFIIANKMVYRYTDPKVGDIVVFHPPPEAFSNGEPETDYIKRLVGAPGDIVEVRDMVLYRNGEPINEPYLFRSVRFDKSYPEVPKDQWPSLLNQTPDFKFISVDGKTVPLLYKGTIANKGFGTLPAYSTDMYGNYPDADTDAWIDLPAAPVPEGYYFFMGDHRNGSSDGRMWGLVPRDNIIGRSEYIMLPFNRISKTR